MALNRRGRKLPPATPTPQNAYRRGRAESRFAKSRHSPASSSDTKGQDVVSSSGILDATQPTDGRVGMGGQALRAGPFGVFPATHGRDNIASCGQSGDSFAAAAELDGIHMALEMNTNGTVGCAYFVAATSTLYLQEDTRIAGLELIESFLFQAQPTTIIVPSRAPDNFIDFLDRLSHEAGEEGTAEDEGRSFVLRSVVSADFNPEYGRQVLARPDGVGIRQTRSAFFTTAVEDAKDYVRYSDAKPHLGVGASERNKLMHLGTFINLDDQVSLGCVGALVRDLENRQAAPMPTDTSPLQIRSILTVTYNNCMFVAADTLLSLQIFRPDLRQGSGRGVGTNREGSVASASQDKGSVFDLFHSLALTSQGRGRLREIFIRPSIDLAVINARHQSIASLLNPENQATVGAIRSALKGVKNIQPMLVHLRRGLFFPGNFPSIKQSAWANLQEFCSAVLQLLHMGQGALHNSCDIVNKALSEIDPEAIFQVRETLTGTIDFQESKSSGRNIVARGVNPELDTLKSTYSRLQIRLEDICRDYKARLSNEAQDDIVECIFHPQKGYLLVAAAILRTRNVNSPSVCTEAEGSNFYSWEEALQEDGLIYFKTERLSDVDAEFGDLAGQIIDLEVEMFHSLGLEILEREDALLGASNAIGDIDSILALASGARTLCLSRPKMTAENVLHIRKGRHLLQEIGPRTFVPNDCRLAGGSGTDAGEKDGDFPSAPSMVNSTPSTIVLTGPNHSGKSVYLKQVATILFLAHVGSFVPAEEAIIGITDKILTRIATRESVSRDESAFGVDLRQAAFSINFATRRSLIVIDEFGKGTATADGAALFDALLDHFLQLGCSNAPKVLAATHFHEIFERGSFKQHPRLSMCHMSVTVDPNALRPEEKVKFLHTMQEGRSTESFGCHCAAISGVTPTVVERAGQITRLLGQGASLSKVCLQARSKDVDMQRGNESRARLFLAGMAEALDSGSLWQAPRGLLQHVFEGEM